MHACTYAVMYTRYIVLVCVSVTFDGALTPLNALEYPGWLFQVSEVYDQILPGILGCRVNVDVFPDFSYRIIYALVIPLGAIVGL